MSTSYTWAFTETHLGKNSDESSFENENDLVFKTISGNADLDASNFADGGYKIQTYDDLAVLDLGPVHNPDASFTIEFTVKEVGSSIRLDKAVNYLTFGYHQRGRSNAAVSVGRDVGSPYVVISVAHESGTTKSTILNTSLITEPNEEYIYTLTYNSFAPKEDKIKLFRELTILSDSSSIDSPKLSIINRKLILGSSGWVNESSWNKAFDIAENIVFVSEINFYSNRVLDKEFLPGTPRYPVHYALTNVSDSDRNSRHVASDTDTLEIKFHSTYDVQPSTVLINIVGAVNVNQVNVDNAFVTEDINGNSIVSKLYTYQFNHSAGQFDDGFLSYGVIMDGSSTLSNIIPPTNNIYVDGTPAIIEYSVNAPSDKNVSMKLEGITDNLHIDLGMTNYNDYTITFYASNDNHIRLNQVPGSSISLNTSYFVEGLTDESFYRVYATITDPVGKTSTHTLPIVTEQGLIETNDVRKPVIPSIVSNTIRNDADFSPGINIQASVYDTATRNGHSYDLYLAVFEQSLGNDNAANYNTITTVHHTMSTQNNYEAETFTFEVFQVYDASNELTPVSPDRPLYIYVLAVDDSNNYQISMITHTVNNTLTFRSIVSDFELDSNIAQQGNTLSLEFESLFKLFDASDLSVTILGEPVVPTSPDGVVWTATKLVTQSHPSGPAPFVVRSLVGDYPPTFSNNHDVFVQTSPGSIKSGYTFSHNLQALQLNNIADYIDDYTINSNNNYLQMEFYINGETITHDFDSKSDIPDVFTFTGLQENTTYDVRMALSNVFTKSPPFLLSSESTLFDIPSITMVAQPARNDLGEPVVEVKSTAVVSEYTSPFDLYVEMTDFPLDSVEAASNFFLNTDGMIKRVEDNAPGENLRIVDLTQQSFLNQFWKINEEGEYVGNNLLVPTNNSVFYVHALVNDKFTPVVYASDSVEFSYKITNAAVSNLTNGFYTRNSDTVVMEWSTFFRSYPENYADVRIFNIPVTPTSSDTFEWRAEVTLPATGNIMDRHTMTYLDSNVDIDGTTHVILDNYPTTFNLTSTDVTHDSLIMQMQYVQDRGYNGGYVPPGIDNLFNVTFSASNNASGKISYPSQDMTFENLSLTNFVLDGLDEFVKYYVDFEVVDPAGNVSAVSYNGGNVISTAERNVPIITNAEASFCNILDTNKIAISNIGAYDTQSDFNIYIGAVSTSNYLDYLNSNTLKDFAENGVYVSPLIPKSSEYVYIDAEVSDTLYYDADSSTWKKRRVEYNKTHYVLAFVEDIYGNSAWTNNIQLASVAIGPPPAIGMEIPPESSPTAGMEVLSGADTNIRFEEIANDDGSVSYVGTDTSGSGNDIIINAISNPFNSDAIVSEQSLDMGLVIDSVELPSSVSASSNVTYSVNVKNKNGTFGTQTVLFENATNNVSLSITDSGITLKSNEQHAHTFLVENVDAKNWNNITFSQEVVDDVVAFRVFMNGNEIYPSQIVGTNSIVNDSGSSLNIPSQQNLLVDGIVLYNSPANVNIVNQLGNTAVFKVKLDFEDAFVVDYNVEFINNQFIFNNDMDREGIIMHRNVNYTFNQGNTGLPLIFSTEGVFPIPPEDDINVNYYLNDILIGNDPNRYAQEFYGSSKNKIVVRPKDDDYTMYYHSTNMDVLSAKVVTLGYGDAKLHNKASTNTGMQPNYMTTPHFTSNTVAGSYAMEFNPVREDYLFFNNLNMDANTMTMSMWIHPDSSNDTDIPLITQKDAFELGFNKDQKLYFNVLTNDTTAPIIDTRGVYSMSDESISMSNITLQSPIKSTTYMYAMATQTKLDKLEVMQLMDQYKDDDMVYHTSFTSGSSTTIPEFELTTMLAADKTSTVDIERVTSANLYVGFRYSTDPFSYGTSNDYFEASITNSDVSTRVVMDSSDVVGEEGAGALNIEFSIFNNSTSVTQYIAFGVLQNTDGTIGLNNAIITPEIVEAFIYSTEFNDALAANVAAGAVHNYTSLIMANTLYVASGNTVSLTRAFTDLLDTSVTTHEEVQADASYATVVVAFTVADALAVGTSDTRELFSMSRSGEEGEEGEEAEEEEEDTTSSNSKIVINQYETLDNNDTAFTLEETGSVNAYAYVIDETIPKGTVQINVEDATGFAENDSVFVHQTQFYKQGVSSRNYTRAGMYETTVISSVEGNVITFAKGLRNTYYSGEAYSTSANVTQLVRIPRYDTFVIPDGVTLEPDGWNGKTGGICILRTDTLEMNGTCNVSATKKGFRGGGGNSAGEGIRGGGKSTEGETSRVTTWTRHGAGSSYTDSNTGGGSNHSNLFGCGGGRGGGGGHLNNGKHGGCPHGHYNSNTPGWAAPGAGMVGKYIHFGGGGGGGGNGGGVVIIIAKHFTGDATKVFESDGEITGNSCGAGGSVILITEDSVNTSEFQLNVAGGVSSWHYGGDSSDGVKRVLSMKQRVRRAKGEFFGTKSKKMNSEFESAEPTITTIEKSTGAVKLAEGAVKNVRFRIKRVMLFTFLLDDDAPGEQMRVDNVLISRRSVIRLLISDEFKSSLDSLIADGAIYAFLTPIQRGGRLDITDAVVTKAFTSVERGSIATTDIDETKRYVRVLAVQDTMSDHYRINPRYFISIDNPKFNIGFMKRFAPYYYIRPEITDSDYGVQYRRLVSQARETNELLDMTVHKDWDVYSSYKPITYFNKLFINNNASGLRDGNLSDIFATTVHDDHKWPGYDASSRNGSVFFVIGKLFDTETNDSMFGVRTVDTSFKTGTLVSTAQGFYNTQRGTMLDIMYDETNRKVKYGLVSSHPYTNHIAESAVVHHDNILPFVVYVEVVNSNILRVYHNNVLVMNHTHTANPHVFYFYDNTSPSASSGIQIFGSGSGGQGQYGSGHGGVVAYVADVIGFNRALSGPERFAMYDKLKFIHPNPLNNKLHSISFQLTYAIRQLPANAYEAPTALTHMSTEVTGNYSVHDNFAAGGFTVALDSNNKRYITINPGESYGRFEGGTHNFTVAMIVSAKGLTSNTNTRITFGPDSTFNTHLSTDGIWPYDFTMEATWANYSSADYCLMIWSFDKTNDKVTTILRTNTDVSHAYSSTVDSSTYSDSETNADTNHFALVTEEGDEPVRIYELMILQEYLTDDVSKYHTFIVLEEHFKRHYGIKSSMHDLLQKYDVQQDTLQKIGGGWKMIKHLPGDSTKWFPGNDNLLDYPGDEFLFATGDFSRWLITDHAQVNGSNYDFGAARTVTKSSTSDTPYTTTIWHNRSGTETPEDPWVGWSYDGPGTYVTMYGENSNTHNLQGIHSSGMYVFTRSNPIWHSRPRSNKYRISMKPIVDGSWFRGSELAFLGDYVEPTAEYLPKATYTTTPNSYNDLSDGTTTQMGINNNPDSNGYRIFEIEYSAATHLKQIYVGSTDGSPTNNSGTYDKEIKIEAWDGSAYVPHSTIVWEDLPDADGVTRATSGDNYFPWQPSHNTTTDRQVYPLIGGRGKQILRYDPINSRWYHYVAYGYADGTGVNTWPKTFDYDGTGDKTVY